MIPPWLQSWQVSWSQLRGMRVVQAATASEAGEPRVRCVILRGYDDEGRFWFATDGRSAKAAALRARPQLELCAWLPHTLEQYRFRGTAHLADTETGSWRTERLQVWEGLAAVDRASFLAPPPGRPLQAGFVPPALPTSPPRNFLLVVLDCDEVDHLRLGEPHRRLLFRRGARSWTRTELVP